MKEQKHITITSLLTGFILVILLFQAQTTEAANSPDLNSDGCVNFSDVNVFKNYYTTNTLTGDVNADGKVSTKDLTMITNSWAPSCTPPATSRLKHIWQGDVGSIGASKITFLAQHFDLVIAKINTTSYDANGLPVAGEAQGITNLRNAINQSGRDVKILQYFKFAGTHTTSTDPAQTPPYASAFVSNNLTWMSPFGTPYVPTDTTPGWWYGDWQNTSKVSTYLGLVKPYLAKQAWYFPIDGFFFDNAMLLGSSETSHLEGDGQYHSGYPDGYNAASLWNGKHDIAAGIRADAQLSNKILFANNFWNKPYVAGSTDPNNSFQQTMNRLQFYDVVNGILRERPFWKESSDTGECRDKVNLTLDTLSLAPVNKDIILYNYGTSRTGRIFGLAGALLLNKGNVYYLAGPLGGNNYFPEYDIDLGAPVADMVKQSSTLYTRDFTNGKVAMFTDYRDQSNCVMSGSTLYNPGTGYEMLTGFTGTGTYTDIGTMTWADVPVGGVTLDVNNPAYVFRKK